MASRSITVTINGEAKTSDVEDRLLLVHLIRDNFALTGTHIGCDTTHCGACTILLDGKAVKSCTVFAVQANGRDVTTIEGMEGEALHPLQEGFVEEHGLQCGFCTPGITVTLTAYLKERPDATRDEVRECLSGNFCRCGTYPHVFEAALEAGRELRMGGK